jgi:hypothetical protein
MKEAEIQALMHLMDDPDDEVFSIVTNRLFDYGIPAIPHLEALWENSNTPLVQNRIEDTIHKIQFNTLEVDITSWLHSDEKSLLDGAILSSRYHFPDLSVDQFKDTIGKIRKMIWLELNDYLTPLEQLHIFNSTLYHFYKLTGGKYNYEGYDAFLLNKVLEKRQGNALSNGILFQILANMLDLPIRAVKVPNHYLLAFFRVDFFSIFDHEELDNQEILFFIDASSGNTYSYPDMIKYLDKVGCLNPKKEFRILSNTEIVGHLFGELAQCQNASVDFHRKNELEYLSRLVKNYK